MNGPREGYWIENGVLWHASNSSGDFNSKCRLEDADLATLKIFNQTWAKDAKRVWAHGMLVRKVFAPAFEALNASFGRDNECVFDSLGRVVKDVNPATFAVLDDGLCHDDRLDLEAAGYARCDGKIYHYERFNHKTTYLRGADAETFEVLKWGFARDKTKVFHGTSVAKANPATFRQITCRFSEDGRKVFYYNRPIPGADPATFEYLGDGTWGRDKHRVFRFDQEVPGPDAATSRFVGSLLVDATRVFDGGKAIEGLDAASLEHLGSRYYVDKSRVYCNLGGGFIEGADRATFEKLAPKHPSGGDAWDKNWIYRREVRLRPRSEFQE